MEYVIFSYENEFHLDVAVSEDYELYRAYSYAIKFNKGNLVLKLKIDIRNEFISLLTTAIYGKMMSDKDYKGVSYVD